MDPVMAFVSDLPLRDRMIAEKLIRVLRNTDGKFRIFSVVAKDIDAMFLTRARELLVAMREKGLVDIKTDVVPSPNTRGDHRSFVQIQMYRWLGGA